MALLFKDQISGRMFKSVSNSTYAAGLASVSQAASGHYRHPGAPPSGAYCGGVIDAISPAATSFSATVFARSGTLEAPNSFMTLTFAACKVGDVYLCGPTVAATSTPTYHLVAE